MSVYVICNSEMPLYRLPEGAKVIWLNSEKAPKSDEFEIIHGYDFCENPEHVHNYLAGSLGAYVILQLLLEKGEKAPEKTTIWQYRKFVSQTKYGEPTKNYPGMYSVNKGKKLLRLFQMHQISFSRLFLTWVASSTTTLLSTILRISISI